MAAIAIFAFKAKKHAKTLKFDIDATLTDLKEALMPIG